MSNKPQTLKGFRDFLPQDMAIRNRIKKILVDVFESCGFEPLSTPSLEYADVLLGKYGPEADKLVYTFDDRGGRRVGMPYDLTVPTARVAAQYSQQLPTPFKRYQIQRVWRAENTQRGRYREFEQCDIDILNSSSPLSDAEILSVIAKVLSRLSIPNFQILLNSRPLLYAIIRESGGIPDEKRVQAAISIDKLDKITQEDATMELLEKGIEEATITKFFEITNTLSEQYPTSTELIESRDYKISGITQELLNLQEIASNAIRFGVDPNILIPKFTLARGLDYYTGAIFESVVQEPKLGSITGGGRYDQLISQLGGPNWPAVGTTIGLDRIFDIICNLKIWSGIPITPTQILITIFSPELVEESLKVTKLLRESGVNAEIYLDPSVQLTKQLKYADKKGILYAAILGPEELKSSSVVLKNLKTGTQETLLINELPAKIR
jgi:histidyl-tRNA synthetase